MYILVNTHCNVIDLKPESIIKYQLCVNALVGSRKGINFNNIMRIVCANQNISKENFCATVLYHFLVDWHLWNVTNNEH